MATARVTHDDLSAATFCVDAAFAWDEGEGDRTLDDWKRGHWRYFSRECESLGRSMSEDAEVCLERFELFYPFEHALNPVDCGPRIVPGYIPGGLAASCALQAHYYVRHHGFGAIFEAGRLAYWRFLGRYDRADGVWLVTVVACMTIVIDGAAATRCRAASRFIVRGVARALWDPRDVSGNGFLPHKIRHRSSAHFRRP